MKKRTEPREGSQLILGGPQRKTAGCHGLGVVSRDVCRAVSAVSGWTAEQRPCRWTAVGLVFGGSGQKKHTVQFS